MDDHDPTLNNPALDLEDSDDDAEWNPLKDAEKSGKRKRGGDSSEEEDYSEFNNIHQLQLNKHKNKRRAYQQANSSQSIQNRKSTADTPEVPEEEDFKVSVECYLAISTTEHFSLRLERSLFLRRRSRVPGPPCGELTAGL